MHDTRHFSSEITSAFFSKGLFLFCKVANICGCLCTVSFWAEECAIPLEGEGGFRLSSKVFHFTGVSFTQRDRLVSINCGTKKQNKTALQWNCYQRQQHTTSSTRGIVVVCISPSHTYPVLTKNQFGAMRPKLKQDSSPCQIHDEQTATICLLWTNSNSGKIQSRRVWPLFMLTTVCFDRKYNGTTGCGARALWSSFSVNLQNYSSYSRN